MRKYHQKQILALIKTLNEANSEMKLLLSKKDTSAVLQLLSDCQQGAVQIGEFIERLEGNGTNSVAFLEDYCELLYHVGNELSHNRNSGGFYKQIHKQLVKIENSIKTELKPDKIEMVFLPYKASMWDSMESIWLSAKDDPQCDAYVIPIPYFDKQPDGALGQMNYEGDQYPGCVPIIDWQKYNIEERHPDVIVIHSPYDEGNFVTSLHPHFFSDRLKGFTDLLVYVPYFICADDVEKHFCVCAGTLYADKVIVQSEKIRNTYVRTFEEFEKENNCKGRFGDAESKFVALGSPKFDKVITAQREDFKIPDEWKKMIERPDGTRKKVILYNTSISGLLYGNEKALPKLRDVFDCFKGQDDVALLWRPHPLNNVTYQVMRPQLLNEYNKIVVEFQQLGFGIYDDTPDLHRAIALSDAYFGDSSSLVPLFQCAGKPVMVQDFSVNQKKKPLIFENLYEDKDNFWFTSYNYNALFKMDKQTWEAEYVGSFPGEKANDRLFGPITCVNGNLVFAPNLAAEIAEYDLEHNTFKRIPSLARQKEIDISKLVGSKFYNTVHYKNHLFFVGCFYPGILRIDTVTGQSEFFTDWLEPLDKRTMIREKYYIKSISVVGSLIMAAALNTNAVVCFDMDSCTSQVFEVGSKGCCYSGICYDGRHYWLSPRFSGPIVKWAPNASYKEFFDFPEGFSANDAAFWNICYSGGFVWLFPNSANMALKIDIQDENIVVAEEFQRECEYDIDSSNYIYSMVSNDVIYALTGKTNRLISFDCKNNQKREDYVLPLEKDTSSIFQCKIPAFTKDPTTCTSMNDFIFYEQAFWALTDFISYISQCNGFTAVSKLSDKQVELCRNTIMNADGTSGNAIYMYCKQEVMK